MSTQAIKISIIAKKKVLDQKKPYLPNQKTALQNLFLTERIYHALSLTSKPFTKEEIEKVVVKGETTRGNLQDHLVVYDYKNTMNWLDKKAQSEDRLSLRLILQIYRRLLKNNPNRPKHLLRQKWIRFRNEKFSPSDPSKIRKELKDLAGWYRDNETMMDTVELAALFHYKFIRICPFDDANGRIAHLLMNFILQKQGYPPAFILQSENKKYFSVLQDGDMGSQQALLYFIEKAVERSLILALNTLDEGNIILPLKNAYITLSEATEFCEYSQEYLSLLARKGKLPAVKFSRNWMTTKEAVLDYVKAHD